MEGGGSPPTKFSLIKVVQECTMVSWASQLSRAERKAEQGVDGEKSLLLIILYLAIYG
jgi:hypothetical protein